MQPTNHIPSILIANATKDAEELILENYLHPLIKDIHDALYLNGSALNNLGATLFSVQYICDEESNEYTTILTFEIHAYQKLIRYFHNHENQDIYQSHESALSTIGNWVLESKKQLLPIFSGTFDLTDAIHTTHTLNTLTYTISFNL